MTKNAFSDMFGFYGEAVAAVSDGKILYFNGAAADLFPDIREGMAAAEMFPDLLLEGDGRRAGTVTAGGRELTAISVTADGVRIVSVFGAKDPLPESAALSQVGAALKEQLGLFRMSMDLMRPYVEVLREEDKVRRYESIQQHSIYSLTRISGNISAVFGDYAPSGLDEPRLFDAAAMCRDMVSTISVLAKARGISVEFRCGSEKIMFNGRREKIEQLLLNLFSNSLKYTPDGGSITLELSGDDKQMMLRVSDTGCGVSPEVMPTVFARYRQHARLRDGKAGIGLGLAIVSGIARSCGGTAVLDSRPGEGTAVTVSLKSAPLEMTFRTPEAKYDATGMSEVLVQLADALDYSFYTEEYLD